jgi:BTB/POZ domain
MPPEFACYHSPVLRAAFNSAFLEGQTQIYRLDDVSPTACRLLVKWLYSQSFDTHIDIDDIPEKSVLSTAESEKDSDKSGDKEEDDSGPSPFEAAWAAQDLHMAQLWVAGDRLLIPRLQNFVMYAWHDQFMKDGGKIRSLSTDWLSYAYQHTCPGSPLRNMAVDRYAYDVNPRTIAKQQVKLPREMLVDLVLVFTEAVWPTHEKSSDDDSKRSSRILPEDSPLFMKRKPRYRCSRIWRSYLVPDESK